MDTLLDTPPAEFGRFSDLEQRFGIKRSTAYELIARGAIRSACVKRKGARTGIRLIDLASVREFLRAQSS